MVFSIILPKPIISLIAALNAVMSELSIKKINFSPAFSMDMEERQDLDFFNSGKKELNAKSLTVRLLNFSSMVDLTEKGVSFDIMGIHNLMIQFPRVLVVYGLQF